VLIEAGAKNPRLTEIETSARRLDIDVRRVNQQALSGVVGNLRHQGVVARYAAAKTWDENELEGLIDAGAERARLDKTLQAAWSDLAQARGKLANRLFLEKAPAEVVAGQKARAAELSALVEKLATRLTELGG